MQTAPSAALCYNLNMLCNSIELTYTAHAAGAAPVKELQSLHNNSGGRSNWGRRSTAACKLLKKVGCQETWAHKARKQCT
jgi:hypothetical protein